MSDEWFYMQAGQQVGPVSLARLAELHRNGQLLDSDYVWTAGMSDWVQAAQVKDRFAPPDDPLAALGIRGFTVGTGVDAPLGIPSVNFDFDRPSYARVVPRTVAGEPAGFWLRVVATVVDALLVTAILFPIEYAIARQIGVEPLILRPTDRNMPEFLLLIRQFEGLNQILAILYCAFFESSRYQATPGKLAIGIKVTDVDGYQISFWRALGRNVVELFTSCLCGIGYIMAAFGEKRALHDFIAGTRVTRG